MPLLSYDWGVAVVSCASAALDVQWLRSKDRHAVTIVTVSNPQSPETHVWRLFFSTAGDAIGMGDLVEIAQKHRKLLERILAKSTGAIGEILVTDKLTELGYRVEPTNNNAEQYDLTAISIDGRSIGIEVKTSRDRRPTWFVNKCPDPAHSKIWCFVSAPREATELPKPDDVEIYVLTTEEAAVIWSASEYNKSNPKAADIRRHQIPDDALEGWGKLSDVR